MGATRRALGKLRHIAAAQNAAATGSPPQMRRESAAQRRGVVEGAPLTAAIYLPWEACWSRLLMLHRWTFRFASLFCPSADTGLFPHGSGGFLLLFHSFRNARFRLFCVGFCCLGNRCRSRLRWLLSLDAWLGRFAGFALETLSFCGCRQELKLLLDQR